MFLSSSIPAPPPLLYDEYDVPVPIIENPDDIDEEEEEDDVEDELIPDDS